MNLGRLTVFILAASAALAAPSAHAIRTPIPHRLTANLSACDTTPAALSEPLVAVADPAPADAWLIEAVYPMGQADDGEFIDIAVLVEPGTHTRVWCYVKSPLGLATYENVIGKKVVDGVPYVQVQTMEWFWYYMGGMNDAKPKGDAAWRRATTKKELGYFVREGGQLRPSEYMYPLGALAEDTKDFDEINKQMYMCLAASGGLGGGLAYLGPAVLNLGWKGLLTGGAVGESAYLGVTYATGGKPTPGGMVGSFGGGMLGGTPGVLYYATFSQGLDLSFGYQDEADPIEFALDVGTGMAWGRLSSGIERHLRGRIPSYLRNRALTRARQAATDHPGRASRQARAAWKATEPKIDAYLSLIFERFFPGASAATGELLDAYTGMEVSDEE